MTPNHLDSVRETLLAVYDREQRTGIVYPGHHKETLPHVVRFVRTTEPGRGFVRYTWLDGPHLPGSFRPRSIISADWASPSNGWYANTIPPPA